MDKITKVSDLPEWFFNQVYRKQLSDIDWYREIRLREVTRYMTDLLMDSYIQLETTKENPLIDRKKNFEEFCDSTLNRLSIDNIRPDSLVYLMSDRGSPVKDLSVLEAAFLGFTVENLISNNLLDEFNLLLELWNKCRKEYDAIPDNEKPSCPVSTKYDQDLQSFMGRIEDDDPIVHANVEKYSTQLGNPFQSFSYALNGYPLTIDTTFDDETILLDMKKWLAIKRKEENTKSRSRVRR